MAVDRQPQHPRHDRVLGFRASPEITIDLRGHPLAHSRHRCVTRDLLRGRRGRSITSSAATQARARSRMSNAAVSSAGVSTGWRKLRACSCIAALWTSVGLLKPVFAAPGRGCIVQAMIGNALIDRRIAVTSAVSDIAFAIASPPRSDSFPVVMLIVDGFFALVPGETTMFAF